jgi:hypothetical protein
VCSLGEVEEQELLKTGYDAGEQGGDNGSILLLTPKYYRIK